jgi:aryl-alcohol dehydrogenase-like predicted oxidoreductase
MRWTKGAEAWAWELERGKRNWRVPVRGPVTTNDSGLMRMALVALVQRWAERKNAAPAQIALAWLMAQRPWIVPIPGTTQMPHLLENLGAAAVRFTEEELAELNAAASAIQIQGARLPESVLAFSEVEAPPKK